MKTVLVFVLLFVLTVAVVCQAHEKRLEAAVSEMRPHKPSSCPGCCAVSTDSRGNEICNCDSNSNCKCSSPSYCVCPANCGCIQDDSGNMSCLGK